MTGRTYPATPYLRRLTPAIGWRAELVGYGVGEQSHRFVVHAHDPEGNSCTLIGWHVTDLVSGRVVRRVVLSLDSTWRCAVVLTPDHATELAGLLREAVTGQAGKKSQGRYGCRTYDA